MRNIFYKIPQLDIALCNKILYNIVLISRDIKYKK